MAGKGSDFEVNGVVNISAAGANAALKEISEGIGDITRKQEALNKSLGGEKKTTLSYKIVVDDSGVKQLVFFEKERLTVLDRANAELARARRLEDGSVTSLRQQVNQAKQARDEMAKYASSAGGIGAKLGTVNAAWATQNQRVQDLQRQLDIAGASNVWQKLVAEYNLKGLAGAGRQITELVNVFQSVSIIVGQVIGSVNQLFDALQKLQSIKLTFQGIGAGGDVGAVFSESNRIALGLGVSLNTVRDAFQQLSPVILATGGNIGDVSAITESLSSRFVTFGLSADKSRRVMNGVVQAFSKGKLMAEELTQQISEADPAFRTDLAQAIDVSVKELGEMVKAGEVTNQVLLEAIPRMSKSAGLFGKLGKSATDAANGFRNGSVTVEQFRAQLANIEQLALEDLVNPDTGALQPLLASLAELRAVVTDVVVAFAGSEVFETFLDILGQLASQISFVVQSLVKIGSVIASITQPIFGVINAIDSLGGTLNGLGVISSIVAGIITAKLLVAVGSLAASAVVGAAIGGLNLLAKAITALSSGALLGLIKTIGSSILAFFGLGGATTKAAAAEGLATIATKARTIASAALTKQLGLQAAAEGLLGGGKGPGKVTFGGGVTMNPVTTTGQVFGPKTAAEAAKAAAETNKWGQATKNLGTAIKAVPKNPYAIAAAVIVGTVAATVGYTKSIESAGGGTKKFDDQVKNLKESAAAAKEAIAQAGNQGLTFDQRLKNIQSTANGIDLKNLDVSTAGASIERKNIVYEKLIEDAKTYNKTVIEGAKSSKQAVAEYNKENDKSGIQGKKIAEDIAIAEGTVKSALEITRKKRQEMIEEAEKNGKSESQITINQIKNYDQQIKKLEEQEAAIKKTRKEAADKGIDVPVEITIDKGLEALTAFGEKAKALKAQVSIESNPEKRAELQSELNGLEGFLKFIGSDITEVTIEANFKVNTRTLKDAADISQATLDNYKAIADKAQAVYNLETGKVSGKESDRKKELDAIQERLDAEKEIRKEKIEEAKEEGASKAQISALEKQDRAAEKAGKAELLAKENELKALADQKKQIEFNALNAKKAALPAQQAAERESLNVAQKLAKLELERLKNAATRARNEAILLQTKTGNDISQARLDKDKDKEKTLITQYNLLSQNIELLKQEEASLERSRSSQEDLFNLQKSTLGTQQESARLGVDAELAALGTQTATQGTAAATQATAAAGSNAVSNAKQFAALASQTAGAQGQVATATQLTARAGSDAVSSAQQMATSAENAATAAGKQLGAQQDLATASQTAADGARDLDQKTGDAQESTDDAATAAGTFGSNMQTAAGWAKSVSDTLTALDGTEVNFSVNFTGTQGLWTGGPTVGGQTYRINELGKEGFLSSSGTLSPINKPRNALWKAPGRGMVIPAHIMSKLDVPTGRVSTGVRPSAVGTGGNGLTKIARAIQAALSQSKTATKAVTTGSEDNDLVKIARDIRKTLTQSNTVEGSTAASNPGSDSLISIARDIQSTLSQPNKSDSALQEMAAVQAHQALQIGKLSRAVTKLADKDWNVNVGVRNTGSTAYLDALNRRM